MTHWQITLALIMGGMAVGLLYNISSKIDAMSRLMHDRALRDHNRFSN